MTAAGLRDSIQGVLGRDPYYIPIVGPPGTLAAMATADAQPGYSALYPDGFAWRNEVPARIVRRITTYSPGKVAADIACPLLVLVAGDDVVTPPEPARAAARRAPRGELVEYERLGHFDVYVGEPFERAAGHQRAFLARTVPV